MVPPMFAGYFAASAAAAGALIGLLFVAISLRPETVFGAGAAPAARAVAGSAFTALVNSFLVALIALIPGTSLGVTAAVMALISLASIARLHRGLASAGALTLVLVLSVASYAAQFAIGVTLAVSSREHGLVRAIAYLVIASFAVGLTRAWDLLQGRHVHPSRPELG